MKTTQTRLIIAVILILLTVFSGMTQSMVWKLEDCIIYDLGSNIQVKKADLTNNQNQLYANQAQANRLPSLNASASQNFNWYKGFDSSTGQYGSSKGSSSSNYSCLLYTSDAAD